MTISTLNFIDANIFLERWSNVKAASFLDKLDPSIHCTSVLVLSEVSYTMQNKRVEKVFECIRDIMGCVKVYDLCQVDLFNALKNPVDISFNDKLHIEVMKRNGVSTIVSYDKDFDELEIKRVEP